MPVSLSRATLYIAFVAAGVVSVSAAALSATTMTTGASGATRLYASIGNDNGDDGVDKQVWVAAMLPNLPQVFFRTRDGWTAWNGVAEPQPVFSTNEARSNFDLIGSALDLDALGSAQVWVGYAPSWTELLRTQNFSVAYAGQAKAPVTVSRYVAPTGSDANPGTIDAPWRTIQHAITAVSAGTTINLRGGVYGEQVTINRSGSAQGGYLTIQNYPGENPILDGSALKVPTGNTTGLITLNDVSYVKISGLEVRNYTSDSANAIPAGILLTGAGNHIVIANNVVHHIKTTVPNSSGNAFGIAVYGSKAPAAINQLTIDGNEVANLTTGSSESITVNGNVQYFVVSNNKVHDNNNIGIDIIGYEGTAPNPAYDRARDGVVSGNLVYNISSKGNPAYGNDMSADGIYVDGGTRIVIEGNTVAHADIGIEVASEHPSRVSDYVTVRSNVVYQSNVVGISIGGYSASVGGTDHCTIVNNTLYQNDTQRSGTGELSIQFHASNNQFKNNLLFASPQGVLVSSPNTYAATPLAMDGNLYYSTAALADLTWRWNGKSLSSLAAFQAGSGNDKQSRFVDPLLINAAQLDFKPRNTSPAVNAGLDIGLGVLGSTDIAGSNRVLGGKVDIGAFEQ